MKGSSKACAARRRPSRMGNLRFVRPAWAAALLCWFAVGVSGDELSHALPPVAEPVPAPDFALEDMDDETHRLSDYRGRVVIVNFWATWCGPCRRELPSLERLYQALRERGLVVLAVNEWEDPDHVFAYMGQLAVEPSFPILFDRDARVARAYGIKGLPTTVIVDQAGRMVYRAVGGRDFTHPEVRARIEALLPAGGSSEQPDQSRHAQDDAQAQEAGQQ